jgi:hypothetical protein
MILKREFLANELMGLRQQMAQTQSQLDGIAGAIQTIEQLINVIDMPDPESEAENESQVSS